MPRVEKNSSPIGLLDGASLPRLSFYPLSKRSRLLHAKTRPHLRFMPPIQTLDLAESQTVQYQQ